LNFLITPTLEKSLVSRRGIATVPEEMATVSCECVTRKPCSGLAAFPLVARNLELELARMGKLMVGRLARRGYEWLGELKIHGPWPSYEFNERLADIEAEAWKRAAVEKDLSYTLPFVFEWNAASPYKDYLLVGDFLLQNVLTEVIVKE